MTQTPQFPAFEGFPKIARLSREVYITEKIDGTNAQVYITDDGKIYAGSRNQWITPQQDNYGFARWVAEHAEELLKLGPGRHFGEWWGAGIQRGYGLVGNDKRFSLFNVERWCLHGNLPQPIPQPDPRKTKMQDVLPPCVGLVPLMHKGIFSTTDITALIENLRVGGSWAVPGYMNPEGIVIYHVAAGVGFKKTLVKDETPKSKA